MSDRTSQTILDGDKILQERRKKEGKTVTPYNYDTNIDKDLAVTRSQTISQEKILDNNQTLVQYALEANAPQKGTVSNNTQKSAQAIEVANLNTSAIPSKETTKSSRGDDDEKAEDER